MAPKNSDSVPPSAHPVLRLLPPVHHPERLLLSPLLFFVLRALRWVGLRFCSNEGAQTIEAELEMAVYLAGAMSKDNFGNLRKVSWSRSGRTDKGVHAAAQVGGWVGGFCFVQVDAFYFCFVKG